LYVKKKKRKTSQKKPQDMMVPSSDVEVSTTGEVLTNQNRKELNISCQDPHFPKGFDLKEISKL
jgi:hypothetical protein